MTGRWAFRAKESLAKLIRKTREMKNIERIDIRAGFMVGTSSCKGRVNLRVVVI